MPGPSRLLRRQHRFFRRVAAPKDVETAMGKSDIIRSLNTADHREALRRRPLAGSEVDAEFAEARRRLRSVPVTSLSEHETRQMALRWLWREERRIAEREFDADRSRTRPQEDVLADILKVLGQPAGRYLHAAPDRLSPFRRPSWRRVAMLEILTVLPSATMS